MNSSLNVDVQENENLALEEPFRVLIVEDDITMKPLWDHILLQVMGDAHITWVKSEQAAEKVMNLRNSNRTEFDVIICDIFLTGGKTGIDLWRSFQDQSTKFILTSVLNRKKFYGMLDESEEPPFFLEKPIRTNEAIWVLGNILQSHQS